MYKNLRKRGKYYYAQIRLKPTDKMTEKSLGTSDKEIAEKKLNEMFRQIERETEGIATPTKMKNAAQLPLGKHLYQYLVAREAEWTSEKHAQLSRDRLKLMIRECGWQHLRDIDKFSFEQWRSQQSTAPKTLNDYLSILNQFLVWLVDNGFLEFNPLVKVKRIQVRGRTTFQRRALSWEEIGKLLGAVENHPDRKLAYLAAMYTGLRRAELVALEWGDVMMDADSPYLAVRARTTKNGKDAEIPLHPAFLEALQKIKPKDAKPTGRVLSIPDIITYREDLKRAGIEYHDDRGNKADFHALRKTYGTLMQLAGVNPRTAQELMRHSDSKLTMQIYTDARLLPKVAAIHSLPNLENAIPAAISDMAKCGKTSLGMSQNEEGNNLHNGFDMSNLGSASPGISETENGARGGIRTLTALTATRPSTLRVYQFHHPSRRVKKRIRKIPTRGGWCKR